MHINYLKIIIPLLLMANSFPLFAQKEQEAAYKKAIDFINKGKHQKGFEWLDKALALQSNYYDALNARAYYNFERGNYGQAIPDYDTILAYYPADTATYRYRGLANLYTKNYQAAQEDLLYALSLDSTDSGIYSDLGYFYFQVMNYDEAIDYFNMSIAIKPNRFAFYQKAQTYYSIGDFKGTLEALDRNLELEKKDADALRLKALIFLNTKKYGDAIKIYEQLLSNSDIEEPDDFFNWGLTYYMQKKYPQALTYFKTPKKHNDPDLFYYTGLTQYRLKDTKAALKSMDQAVSLTKEDTEESAALFYNRAIAKLGLKDKKGAVLDYLKAISLTPEIIGQQDRFGDTLDVLGNAAILLKGFYTQQQVDTARAIGYQQRALSLLEEDDFEQEALEYINKAISLDNSRGKSYFTRARINYQLEEYTQALQDVNKAITLDGQKEDDRYYYLRGLIFYEMDLPQKANQDFSKAISMNEKSPDYYYDRAFALAGLGEYKGAIADIDHALTLNKEERLTYLLARSGFYNEINQHDKALADCNELLENGPDRAVVYYQRGVALSGLKKYNEAVADFTKALRIAPDFAEANDALREALQKLEK